ncbi:MAG: hypothetical protein K0A98_01815 [Trueperaceae bacterium]|nr:hypothetical protein [Trueperaceae bacterium]
MDAGVSRSARAHAGADDADEAPSAPPLRSTRIRVVRDPAAARALVRPSGLRRLTPFIGPPRTVTEVARETGERPNTILRRVQRLLALGLLEVADTRPRAGRPLRRYRATADVFFVPFEATGAEDLEAALAERDAYWERLLRRHVVRARSEAMGVWGTRIYRDARGRVQVQTAVSPDANASMLDDEMPAALSAWRDQVWLDHADAKALQRELYDLVQRYQRARGAQRYVVHVGLAALVGGDA